MSVPQAAADVASADTTTIRQVHNRSRRLGLLVFLPVLGALVGVWLVSIAFMASERRFALERIQSQLTATVTTLADFNELADEATGDAVVTGSDRRRDAIWRALLQYPTASIWVVSDGVVSGGQPPVESTDASIVVDEIREGFSVHAALPREDALEELQESAWRRGIVLSIVTVAVLLLTWLLLRALQQRASAEQSAVVERERAAQLSRYKVQLEDTVARRTGELKESNRLLERELTDRKAAERELQQHDALLHAVAKGASELLSAPSLEDATDTVLALIGRTVGVSRVHINTITTDRDGHLKSSIRYEWCAPGMTPVLNNQAFQDVDLTTLFPQVIAPLIGGRLVSFYADDLSGDLEQLAEQHQMRSFLEIPIVVEEKLWGSFNFIDSGEAKRHWNWAETDTLQTLAGLIGVAITRARYVKELADANMIVQNSPTILYRLQGEPPFPLIYVSHNITKFGHDATELVGKPSWANTLMDAEDEAKVAAAMARTVDKNVQGATIEFRLRTGEGTYRWVENRYTPVRDKHGRLVEIEGMIIDITERKTAEEKIALLARTDSLTGLSNRATFIDRLRQAFAAAKRGATPFSILYLDLDHFKQINDTLGHPTGDALLREVAERLKSCTRASDVVARLGGDEFAVLQTEMNEVANAGALAATIQTALTKPYTLDGNDLHVTVSIGICPYVPGSTSPDAMLSQADLALYRSKEEGRNRYRFHSDDLDHQVLERMVLAEELRSAIDNGELELYYQPQVELSSSKIVGMEALVRWHHPKRGLLAAETFIPVAERTGAIIALGEWVLEQGCRQMREWRDAGIAPRVLTINVSLAQLKKGRELVTEIRNAIEKWGLTPADLSLDVTEATLAQLTLMRSDVLSELRRLGVQISIDDFGSEYSSFDYLRTYHVNHLKIAQSFIDAALDDPDRAATVRAIINLARELGIDVVAWGVETAEQRDLSSETSTIAQGMFFAGPLGAGDVEKLLRHGRIRSTPRDVQSSESEENKVLDTGKHKEARR